MPYGGAYMGLMGLQEILELVSRHLFEIHVNLDTRVNILILGTVALAAINFRSFRDQFLVVLRSLARGFRLFFVTFPAWILRNPLLRKILTSRPVALLWRVVVKPLLLAVIAWGATRLVGLSPADASGLALFVLLASSFVFNTRVGQRLEELCVEGVVEAWREVVDNLIPGLFHAIMEAFERMLQWVEKLLYSVDEWLRFREGQSPLSLAGKASLGLVWGIVAYLVRIYVNLLIEPQVNPIKHFPVVTVSHKMMIPFLAVLTHWLKLRLDPFVGIWLAETLSWANVLLLPGFFGFLVWELKSNWRLYEANRPISLETVVVGSHGETVVRLLRQGFHSGTIPKLFAKLRNAERISGRDKAVVKRRAALHHVEESLRRFVERDVVALLRESRALGGRAIHLGSIKLATNRIRIDLVTDGDDHPPLRIEFVERQGILAAHLLQEGWLESLYPEARRTFDDALIGLYKMSGVQVVTQGDPLAVRTIDFDKIVVKWSTWADSWDGEITGARPPALVAGFSGILKSKESPPDGKSKSSQGNLASHADSPS